MSLQDRVKSAMSHAGIASPKDLKVAVEERTGIAIPQQTVSSILTGRSATTRYAAAIAQACGVDVAFLLGTQDELQRDAYGAVDATSVALRDAGKLSPQQRLLFMEVLKAVDDVRADIGVEKVSVDRAIRLSCYFFEQALQSGVVDLDGIELLMRSE